jgi:glycosyltransferase involved in cell wall biosynthesis
LSNEIPASNTPIRLLAPALWTPERFVGDSAWVEHAPFAFWLMDVLRPRNFVELGAQSGYSYFCFCQAVQRLRLGATCHAVDTWTGDEHAGFYSDEVFQSVARHNDRYSSFSTLLRTTFDDACRYFPDKSVDLLHIDGRHSYDDVRHDFETWRAKLADDAIVLFHGANVRELGFGVWKLFDELKRDHATFEFTHGRGLGVLAVRDIPDALRSFFALDQGAADEWRLSFASLGRNVKEMGRLRQAEAQLLETQERLRAANARAEAQLLETERQLKAAQEREAVVAGRDAQFVQLADELARAEGEIARLNGVIASPWRRLSDSTLWLKLRAAYRHPTNSSKRKRFRREEQERAPSSVEFAGPRRRWSDSMLWLKLRAAYRHPTNSSKRKRFRREEQERAPSSAGFAGSRRRWRDSALWLKLRAAYRHPTNSSKRKRFRREQQERALFGAEFAAVDRVAIDDGMGAASAQRAHDSSLGSKNEPAGREYVPLFKGGPANKARVKLICFYLPQFHAIPENNAWWGEGFTEWTNVRPAQPKFEGHYQPRVPGELGYYNLLDPAVQRRQIELAKLYGVGGFCFYIYWFGGKRLLEKPVENYLNDKTLDLPFCLCWANENWTRRWDGLDNEILIAQQHSPDDDLNFIRTVAVYMRDPRYIRVNGKPMLLVYRPALLPSAKETVKRWRAWCRSNGVGDIYLAYTQSFDKVDPADYDFDAAIEFPPNLSGLPKVAKTFLNGSKDDAFPVYDWREFVVQSANYRKPDYKLFRGVCLGWDNTARRKTDGTIFINCTPALYQRWLNNAIDDTRRRHPSQDEHLVFVNAWNEWAEGTYLEPDARYGYAYLQATRNAVCGAESRDGEPILLVTHDCHRNGAEYLTLAIAKQLKSDGFRVAILALDGGKFQNDFARVGRTFNAKEAGAAGLKNFLAGLRAEGARDAITSTVVSGSIVAQLKEVGFRVMSLIHELPGVIRDKRQEANAAAIARFADKVVFPAEHVCRRFGEVAPVDAEKVVIRHQGLLRKNPYKNRNAEAYRIICERHHLPTGAQIVLSVAHADLRKAPDLFVEIAARVLSERPNAVFIWVGGADREIEQRVASRIQELGLQRRVLFVGFDREPMAYFAAASVYALPSREDPFPSVVLESSDVGVPVVAFEGATGAAEFILEQGGRLAGYLDVGDFARQTGELLAAPAKKAPNAVPSLQRYTLDLLHHLNGYPRISVIVPNYNYERHIARRLDSVFHQTFPIYEVIVLDDGSSDKSVEVIEAYFARTGKEGKLIVNERNSGSAFRQWQKGLACCAGDLVWIAEADDLADCNFLRELASSFDDPNIVLAFSQSKPIDENGKALAQNYLHYTKDISDRWRTSYVNDGRKEIGECLTVKNVIPNVSGVLFRRAALEKAIADIGDELFGYKVAGDWLVYLYVLLQGKLYYNEKPLNLHRRHADSVTKTLDASKHLHEVRQLQEIAQSLSAPTGATLAKAKAYIEFLRTYLGMPAQT